MGGGRSHGSAVESFAQRDLNAGPSHPVLRLCSICVLEDVCCELSLKINRQNEMQDSLSSLFSNYVQLPKLNVAGSIPVSRSRLSTHLKQS